MKDKKSVVFLGASITQGMIGSSYVRILKRKLGTRQYNFINHGIGGYESYNVMKNLDKTVKSKDLFYPDREKSYDNPLTQKIIIAKMA